MSCCKNTKNEDKKLKIGMCVGTNADNIKTVKEFGYDYIETAFHMLANDEDEPYNTFKKTIETVGIPCLSANCFLPNSLPVTGPNVDFDGLRTYIERGMARGEALGIKRVVFGSSGARKVPEGFCYGEAYRQLVSFLKEVCAPICEKHDIILTLEPLRRAESNIINSVQEGAALAALAHSPNIKVLGDLFHMYDVNDNEETIRRMKGMIKHAHVANPIGRHFPAPDDTYSYGAFLHQLEASECYTCSVEASTDDFMRDAPIALQTLREAYAKVQ